MKILVTGGHLTPALSFIDLALKNKDQVIFIGRSHSSQKHGILSREEKEMKKRNVIFKEIDSFKLHRHSKILSLAKLPKLLTAIFKSKAIIKQHKPDVIVSFGGYIAVPVSIAAKMKKIPIFTHEQTRHLGLANKFISKIVDVIGMSWGDDKMLHRTKNAVFTGNPIRKELKTRCKKPTWVLSNKPIIYVTGGNQGSLVINQVIESSIKKLTKSFHVIHQCGGYGSASYLSNFINRKNDLPKLQQDNYSVKQWYSAREVSWILDHSFCVVSRSGANTITEIIYKGVPSILIPLPFSSHNEQYKNAKLLEKHGSSIIIPQNKFSDKSLEKAILSIQENHQEYRNNIVSQKDLITINAEENIYQIVQNLHEKNQNQKISNS